MASLYNRVRVLTPTTGTGTLSIGQPVDGWLDFGEAPVTDGATVSYLLEEGNNVEWGRGVYDLTAGTLTRTVTRSKTADGVVSTDPLSLGGGAELSITALAADFNEVDGDFVPDTDDGSSLGTLSLKWSDLFLASGAVINFDEGDITLTHSANGLDFAGGSFRFPNTGLQAYDTDGSHVLTFAPGSNLTADRTLNFTTGDADRTVTLGGDVSTQEDFSVSGAFSLTLNLTGASSVTLPTTGTLATAEDLASNANGEGASLIGIEDAAGLIAATTVENALLENRFLLNEHEEDTTNPHNVTPAQLSLVIGTDVQAHSADLDSISGGIDALTEETTPADTDVFLMQRASDGGYRYVEGQNLPGSGGPFIGAVAEGDFIRALRVRVSDGTNADTIAVQTFDLYGHTTPISEVDNIGKGTTVSGISLSAGGELVTIDNTLLEDDVVGALLGQISLNESATRLVCIAALSTGNLRVFFRDQDLADVDLTSLVDVDNRIDGRVIYITRPAA